jgi:hypothetical protein
MTVAFRKVPSKRVPRPPISARALVAMATALVTAMLTVACGDDATPTSPTTTATTSTVTFIGALEAGGARFYSFTVTTAGTVTALLASVTSTATGLPVSSALELGIGIPAGTGCAASTTQVVAPALLSQLSTSLPTGTFCLRVADTGSLAGPATFAVRFTYP